MNTKIIICHKTYSTIAIKGQIIITPLTKDLIKIRIDSSIYIGLMCSLDYNYITITSTKEDINIIKRLLNEEYQENSFELTIYN